MKLCTGAPNDLLRPLLVSHEVCVFIALTASNVVCREPRTQSCCLDTRLDDLMFRPLDE
jgi:hypothetical protein